MPNRPGPSPSELKVIEDFVGSPLLWRYVISLLKAPLIGCMFWIGTHTAGAPTLMQVVTFLLITVIAMFNTWRRFLEIPALLVFLAAIVAASAPTSLEAIKSFASQLAAR